MAKKQGTGAVIVEVGAGLAAVGAAAAAGYYFYASKHAKKHRHIAVKWAADAKDAVMEQIRSLPEVDATTVASAIDTALAAYGNARSIGGQDLHRAGSELKAHWRELVSDARKEKVKGRPKRAMVRKTATKRRKT